MARRKSDSPQKAAMREMMQGYLKENDISIKRGNDVNSIMRDMMSVLLEGALDEELNEELGYSKYDYRNKETDNSRNGHSRKTMRTSYGDMDIAIPGDRKGVYEPQLIPKYQNTVTQDMEEKIISMYASFIDTIEYDYPTFHLSMDCFLAEIESGNLVLKEHEAVRWLTREELDFVDWLPADVLLIDTLKQSKFITPEKEV